jgi:hypothetical protein
VLTNTWHTTYLETRVHKALKGLVEVHSHAQEYYYSHEDKEDDAVLVHLP